MKQPIISKQAIIESKIAYYPHTTRDLPTNESLTVERIKQFITDYNEKGGIYYQWFKNVTINRKSYNLEISYDVKGNTPRIWAKSSDYGVCLTDSAREQLEIEVFPLVIENIKENMQKIFFETKKRLVSNAISSLESKYLAYQKAFNSINDSGLEIFDLLTEGEGA